MLDAIIYSRVIGLVIGLGLVAFRLGKAMRGYRKAPVSAGFIRSVSNNADPSQTGRRTRKRKKVTNSILGVILRDALFVGTVSWVTSQLFFIFIGTQGYEVGVANPWYGDTTSLIIVILILGFQVFRFFYEVE